MATNRIDYFYDEAGCDPPRPWEDVGLGCGEDLENISLPPEVVNILESQQATYQTLSYAAIQKMILIPTWEQHSRPREIPPEISSVTEMTKRLFPGCEIKADMIDGEQFNEQSHVLIRVLWSDSQMTIEQKDAALPQWHMELLDAAPTVAAGVFRLQVEYAE